MSEADFPKTTEFDDGPYSRITITQTDENTWHVRDDGMPLGTIRRDERGYFKPGSDARHDDFEASVRLTIRGTIR